MPGARLPSWSVMCDDRGCPQVEPFAPLTVEHEVLRGSGRAAASGGLAVTDLRELWLEQVEREQAAGAPFAAECEFEVYRHLVMAAGTGDLEAAAERVRAVRAGRA